MLEVGLGYIATNLIVVYGLFAHASIRSPLRSLRSLLSLSRLTRLSSRQADSASDIEHGGTWPKETSNSVTSVKYVGRDIEEVPLAGHGIHMKKEFGSRSE